MLDKQEIGETIVRMLGRNDLEKFVLAYRMKGAGKTEVLTSMMPHKVVEFMLLVVANHIDDTVPDDMEIHSISKPS